MGILATSFPRIQELYGVYLQPTLLGSLEQAIQC